MCAVAGVEGGVEQQFDADGVDAAVAEHAGAPEVVEGLVVAEALHELRAGAGGAQEGAGAGLEQAALGIVFPVVGPAVGPDAVEPALEQGGHAVPPDWEDETQRVAALDPGLLGTHVVGHGAALELGEVGDAEDGVETLGVEVGDLDRVAGLARTFGEAVDDGAREGIAARMAEDGKHVHGFPPVGPASLAAGRGHVHGSCARRRLAHHGWPIAG